MSSIFGCPKEFKATHIEEDENGKKSLKAGFNMQNFLTNVKAVLEAAPGIISQLLPIISLFSNKAPDSEAAKPAE